MRINADGPGNELVADFITGTAWNKLPPAVQNRAHEALLDNLAATLSGVPTRVSRIATEAAIKIWPGEQATILLSGRRASAAGAAFANGYAANGLDIDDVALYTRGHPGAQLFPAALAVTEAAGQSGAELMTAMVIGYEVAHRAARIWHATHEFYQACGSWGSVACAAVAAHLMGLDSEQTQRALGIAEYHAPNLPMMRDIDYPAMVKHGIGWGAMNGIISAELASLGFTSTPSLFGLEKYQDWVTDIGQHYIMVDGISWKQYACCAWDHASIVGADKLVKEHGFTAEDIVHVRAEVPSDSARLGVELPTTTEEAQFNFAWPLAAFLVDGEVGPDQILEHRFDDPGIRGMVGKIEVVVTDELEKLYRLAEKGNPEGRYASVIEIELKDGRKLNSGMVEGETNFPPAYWSSEMLQEKFHWLVDPLVGRPLADKLVDMVWHFEEITDVKELTALLAESRIERIV